MMVALLTVRAGAVLASPKSSSLAISAPEQVEGGEADARTDIFAFGSVLYEMITGKKAVYRFEYSDLR